MDDPTDPFDRDGETRLHEGRLGSCRGAVPHDRITGTIAGLRDCGLLVIVFIDAEDGRVMPLPIERRALGRLLQDEGTGPGELVGRGISYDGERLAFLD